MEVFWGHNLQGDPDGRKASRWKSSVRPGREEFLFMLLPSAPSEPKPRILGLGSAQQTPSLRFY